MSKQNERKRERMSYQLAIQSVFEQNNTEFGQRVLVLHQILKNTLRDNISEDDDIVTALCELLEPFGESVEWIKKFCDDDDPTTLQDFPYYDPQN